MSKEKSGQKNSKLKNKIFNNDNGMRFSFKSFDVSEMLKYFYYGLVAVIIILLVIKLKNEISDIDNFHTISFKETKNELSKDEILNNAYNTLGNLNSDNIELDPTNLNLAKVNGEIIDEWAGTQIAPDGQLPVPITMEDEEEIVEIEQDSIAFQIYKKLQNKYMVFSQKMYNLCDAKPLFFINLNHFPLKTILGKFNPEESTHHKGDPNTYIIPNFSNVNVKYYDADGFTIDDDNNIKDIMSMASVYTYYHNPYDSRTFLNYCYELFDNSYSYVASVSEVYYCSGCMHYDDPNMATGSEIKHEISYDKIKKSHEEQDVPIKDIPYKAGTLIKMKDDTYNVTVGNYDEYVMDIYNGKKVSENNYCPGHIDLNVAVTVKTLNAVDGLINIDNYGNNEENINKHWNGWNILMQNRARKLFNKDWEKEYGISLSYITYVNPLTQEEVNYYLNRLPNTVSKDRKKIVETALRSVGRIPYYYGGKTSVAGYTKNYFGNKVRSDYKGRCLRGLDCSGWVNWVYHTAFDREIIKTDGTAKLAAEGRRITRKDLLPGDIIVRPGIDSHVMMFLEWAPGGKMKVIHENGSVNNVSIGVYDAYYPYYRRILDI